MRKVLSLVRLPFRSIHAPPPLDGRHVLISIDSDKEPYHRTVFLENRKFKTRRKVYEYERWAEVLWNPDGNSFALTDYAGSDNALCTIISVDEQILAVPVFENLLKKLSLSEQEKIQRNDHLYIEAVEWIDTRILQVKIWGHDSESRKGFSRFYTYGVSQNPSPRD